MDSTNVKSCCLQIVGIFGKLSQGSYTHEQAQKETVQLTDSIETWASQAEFRLSSKQTDKTVKELRLQNAELHKQVYALRHQMISLEKKMKS